jgi:hypothetical protein
VRGNVGCSRAEGYARSKFRGKEQMEATTYMQTGDKRQIVKSGNNSQQAMVEEKDVVGSDDEGKIQTRDVEKRKVSILEK